MPGRAKSTMPKAMDTSPPRTNMARVPASSLRRKAARDLESPGDDGPAGDEQHEHQRGRPRPGQGDHPGADVDQTEEQVTEHGPGGAAAERLHRLEAGGDERVDGEDDDQGQDGDPRPGEGHDADGDGEQAPKDEGGAE